MEAAIRQAEEDLERIPSLRLKKWNPTRWLGRALCLKALCDAYEYVLEHLYTFSHGSDLAKHKKIAADLYQRLTSYDNLLFIFFYRDLTDTMARTSRLLQARDITVRDVGRIINNLQMTLIESYPKGSLIPQPLIDTGEAGIVIGDLFGEDVNGTLKINDSG
jgi:hypothetical protein